MRVGYIGSLIEPTVITAPIAQWGVRQLRFAEGNSTTGVTLISPVVPGNLLIAIGFYRRKAATGLGPVSWSQLSAIPWVSLSARIAVEGSSQFERGLFTYGLTVTASNQRTIRFSTGFDCGGGDVPDTDCDVLSAAIIEFIPPVSGAFTDPVWFSSYLVDGDNGPTTDGLTVSSDVDMNVPESFEAGYLYVGICGWRIETPGLPMSGLSWGPNQLTRGGIFHKTGIHGMSINWGQYAGNEIFTPTATFAAGNNSGLSMAALGVEYSV